MSIKVGDDQVPYIDVGDNYKIRLEYEEVTDELYIEKARTELRETPENIATSLKELRELLQGEKNFSFPTEEDFFLMTFLRPCKFYSKSAFERMQKYYKFKLKNKKITDDLTVDSVRHVFEQDLIKYLPGRDKNARRVLYFQCGKRWKPSKVSTNDIFRAMQLSLQAAMVEPMTQINGVSVILDMEGLSLSQIIHFTPSFAAMVLEWLQECIAVRLKGIYVINNSYAFNVLFAIFKPFIGSKLRKRIHFLNKDWKALTTHLGKAAVPKDFGGDLPIPEVNGTLLVDFLKLFDQQFENAGQVGYDIPESKKLKVTSALDCLPTGQAPSNLTTVANSQ
ncbi:unnamed protein product [Diamesa hyperborea]